MCFCRTTGHASTWDFFDFHTNSEFSNMTISQKKTLTSTGIAMRAAALALAALSFGQAHAVDRTVTATHIWVQVRSGTGTHYYNGNWTDAQGPGTKESGATEFVAYPLINGRSFTKTRGGTTAAIARRRAAADAVQGLFPQVTHDDIRIAACSIFNWGTGNRQPYGGLSVHGWGTVTWTGNQSGGRNNEYRAVKASSSTHVDCTGTEWAGRP